MAWTRRIAASSAIATLIVPFAAVAAHAALPGEAPPPVHTVSLAVPAQTYIVASAAQDRPQPAREGYTVEVPPPPAPEPVAAPEPGLASVPEGVDEEPSADEQPSDEYVASPVPQGYSGANIVAYAESFVGVVPYGYGNDPSDSFSCDGLVQYVFGQFGISLPRGADSQAALGTVISPAEAQAGDLLWWPGQHIGIYDGAGGMIDSPDFGRYVEHRGIWGSPVYVRL
ncbi:C40 family peptidase [Microbacterium resistens]|uniref:C40 family peptidase n=1 Tax=Microbacterium resistens TaxID=156977 RepID=UPI0036728C3E